MSCDRGVCCSAGVQVDEGVYLVKGLGNHGDLVALVGGLCKALEGGGLYHSLTEGHHRVSNFDFHLGVQLTQILQAVTSRFWSFVFRFVYSLQSGVWSQL